MEKEYGNKRYKVGEFAKNLGVSTGFLKHHEKYGLLKPYVSESGYRYYDFPQAKLAFQCLRLQKMGFTSKDIADILNNTTQYDIPDLLQEKRKEMHRRFEIYKEILEYMDYIENLDAAIQVPEESWTERWGIEEAKPFYYLKNARNGRFEGTPARYEIAEKWNEYMPLIDLCSRFEVKDGTPVLDSLGDWYMGLSIPQKTADHLQVELNEEVSLIRPGKCLIYQFSGCRGSRMGRKTMEYILERPLELCRRHNFRISGDIYNVQIFGSTAGEKTYIQERVIVPI